MAEGQTDPRPHKWRTMAIVVGGVLAALALSVLSIAPSVPEPSRPTAQDVAVGRALVEQVKTSQGIGAPVRLSLDDRELGALSLMAGEASQLGRVAASVDEGLFTVRASFPLVLGLWVNTETEISGTHEGFPSLRTKVGRLPLPRVASRWSAEFLRWVLLSKGVELPELDALFRHLSVGEEAVVAELALPQSTGLVGNMVRAAGAAVDERLVGQLSCRLSAEQHRTADVRLTSLVRQAFSAGATADPVAYNRAAFAALALYVVGDQTTVLESIAAEERARCAPPAGEIVLRDRADLAKHWALSAALTALFDERTAANLGEWKELHDSLGDGSGFSFVDLAADRSGVHIARRALDPSTAEATTARLAAITENNLLPAPLTRAPEGLSDVEFIDRFGGVESARYRQAIEVIDRHLAAATPPR